MKHSIIVASIIIAVSTLLSCTDEGKDNNVALVQKKFSQHIKSTLDNPSSFKEIVEIIPSDTISTEELRASIQKEWKACADDLKRYHTACSEGSKLKEKIEELLKNTYDYRVKQKLNAILAVEKLAVERSQEDYEEVFSHKDSLFSFLCGMQYEAPVYEYKINYLYAKGEKSELATCFAYVDSLSGFKMFLPECVKMKDMSAQNQRGYYLLLVSYGFRGRLNKFSEILEKNEEDYKDFISRLNDYITW